jgi:quercetin dioxygenase-like cupin family protein
MIAITPQTSFLYDGTRMNIHYADKGEGLPRHQHEFSHGTVCTAGSCIVRKEGRELILTKMSEPLNLVHSEWHEIEALEDNTVFINVFADGKS